MRRQQRLVEDLQAPVRQRRAATGSDAGDTATTRCYCRSGMRRLLLAALAAALVAPASASAADPIMPLGDVQAGMRCTGLTVVRGTAITSFDVEMLDVIDRQRPEVARILVRVSGPAVDADGLGPGFSGSPIYCPGADGVARNIGAISDGIGEYGGKVGLATPIEPILAEPVQPPSSRRARARPSSAPQPRRPADALRPQPVARGDVRARGAQGRRGRS